MIGLVEFDGVLLLMSSLYWLFLFWMGQVCFGHI